MRPSVPRSTLPPPASEPHMHRRHTLPQSRAQPLRSSPLSGPALFCDPLPVDTKIGIKEDRSQGPWGPKPNPPTLIQSSLSTSSKASKASRRVSFAAVTSALCAATSVSSQCGLVASSSGGKGLVESDGLDDPSTPHSQTGTLQEMNPENTHNIGCGIHSRGSSSTRRGSGTIESTRTQHPLPPFRQSSPTRDSSEHWMTINTYETTPRFSRLGLTSPNVILPVRARQYQRWIGKKSSVPTVESKSKSANASMSIPITMHVASCRASTSSSETPTVPSRHSSASSTASTSEDVTATEIDGGTNTIDITFPPPIVESIQLKASRTYRGVSCRNVKASGDHNFWVDGSLEDYIPAGFGRRLEIVRDSKRRGMVNRLIRKLSSVGGNHNFSP